MINAFMTAAAVTALTWSCQARAEPIAPQTVDLKTVVPDGVLKTVLGRLRSDQLEALHLASTYETRKTLANSPDAEAGAEEVENQVEARLALLVAANTFENNQAALNAWQVGSASELRAAAMAPEIRKTLQGRMLLESTQGLELALALVASAPLVRRAARYCSETAQIDSLRLGICVDRKVFRTVVGLAWPNAQGQLAISCTGQFLSKRLVLTADHCFDGRTTYPVVLTSFTGGTEQAVTVNGTIASGLRKHGVAKVDKGQTQPAEGDLRGFDLAIIELTDSADVDGFPTIGTAMPTPLTMTVAGWGKTDMKPVNATALEVTVISPQGTVRVIEPSLRAWPAVPVSGGGICSGDSGGPIFSGLPVTAGTGAMKLVGIVAGGNEDCRSGDQVMTDLTRREAVKYICDLAANIPNCPPA